MTQPITTNRAAPATTAAQYLSFRLGAEEYAIAILGVQEIKGYTAITPIPNAPAHVKGVINLRGTVVPVMGLRERFGMEPVAYDKFTVIIVVSVGAKVVGIVVDSVTDVLTLDTANLESAARAGGGHRHVVHHRHGQDRGAPRRRPGRREGARRRAERPVRVTRPRELLSPERHRT